MGILIAPKVNQATKAINSLPAVSIIMPFNPKMKSKTMLDNTLGSAAVKVERELHENYDDEMADLLVQKLRSVLSNLNFDTHTISLAIYVSPVFQKVLYLNMPVVQKIVVDESFEILDLVYSKKELRKYIVLLLSDHECRMYLGDPEKFVKVLSNTPGSAYAFISRAARKFLNFSEIPKHQQVTDEFLRYNDNVLDITLNAHHRPLFVLGKKKILEQFKKLTKHSSAVIEYVHGNYEEVNLEQLEEAVAPYVANWKKVKQKRVSNQLKDAADKKELTFGINDVWLETMNHRGHLLVIEKNYTYTLENRNINNTIYKALKPYNKYSYVKNQLDEAIENVLENGGDVEFVDKHILRHYNHIALIK